jgi:ComF family protein
VAEATALVLLAPSCAVCGTVVPYLRTNPVCDRCWASVQPFTPPFCDRCGDPLASGFLRDGRPSEEPGAEAEPPHQFGHGIDRYVTSAPWSSAPSGEDLAPGQAAGLRRPRVCAHCAASQSAIDRGRAIGSYDGALRDIVHALKYGKRQSVARRLGRLMRQHAPDLLDGADIAVPVPLHWWRRQRRGFNQAELLARQLGLPVCRLLQRVRRTRPQVDLPARERHANVEGAFALRWRETWQGPEWLRRRVTTPLEGLTVVLVDDVSTTGATLEACATVLKRAGANQVRAITAARVVTRRRW